MKVFSKIVCWLYNLCSYLALPGILGFFRLRARKDPRYKENMSERLGHYKGSSVTEVIWVHAVSVGEVRAVIPLVRKLREQLTNSILVTCLTPTGLAQIRETFGDQVEGRYLPLDTGYCVERFLKTFRPRIGLIMETELWPNLISCAKQRGVPLLLINARLSPKSVDFYQRLRVLFLPVLSKFEKILVQSAEDYQRFRSLGIQEPQLMLSGNLKYDLELNQGLVATGQRLKRALGPRPVLVAASTHTGEENLILEAFKGLRVKYPSALLVIVPRHLERFEEVYQLAKQDFNTLKYSELTDGSVLPEVAVLLGDRLGQLLLFYCLGEVTLVGGSLVPKGGHNLLEPAALGIPILAGPHLFACQEISDRLLAAEGLRIVENIETLQKTVELLWEGADLRKMMAENAQQVLAKYGGATDKILSEVMNKLD